MYKVSHSTVSDLLSGKPCHTRRQYDPKNMASTRLYLIWLHSRAFILLILAILLYTLLWYKLGEWKANGALKRFWWRWFWWCITTQSVEIADEQTKGLNENNY